MSKDGEFTPRLGRIRDLGTGPARAYRKRVARTAARLAQPGKTRRFTGRISGRGLGALPQTSKTLRQISRARMRRVIVKTYIARAKGASGPRAFAAHVTYVQRDGVERDGSGGQAYTKKGKEIEPSAFSARSQDDRHQFRLIVSPEDGHAFSDLKETTRALMAQMERDLGTGLDWMAVDHHNTGHPHTHIVLRGKDAAGKDLIIAPNYLMKGVRGRAEQIITNELGPRRDLEMAHAAQAEVTKDRFTSIDRAIADGLDNDTFSVAPAQSSGDRFKRRLHLQRLAHLESLELVAEQALGEWRFKPGWQNTLKALGKRGDIIRALTAGLSPGESVRGVRFIDERPPGAPAITGTVISKGPEDELRDTRFLLIEDASGTRWHVPGAGIDAGNHPPRGAIVDVSTRKQSPRAVDQTVDQIAKDNGGYYSDSLHAAADPSASDAFRNTHKRRLEALRRQGLVKRRKDGVWVIPDKHLQNAMTFDAERGGVAEVKVRSWMTLKRQERAQALTWVDEVEIEALSPNSRIAVSKQARLTYLRETGLLADHETTLSQQAQDMLKADELQRALKSISGETSRTGHLLKSGETFKGQFEKTIDLASGRRAVFGAEKSFVLVPWRPGLERQRGRTLEITATPKGVSWTITRARTRGISR